jgi:hypothetical protein
MNVICDYRTNVFRPASRWLASLLVERKHDETLKTIKETIGIGGSVGHFVGALFEHLVHQQLVPPKSIMLLPLPDAPRSPVFHCRSLPPQQPLVALPTTTSLCFPIEVDAKGWPICHTFSDIKELTNGAAGSYWRPLVSNFPTIDGIILAHPNAAHHPLPYPALLQMTVGTKTEIKFGGLKKVLEAIFGCPWRQGHTVFCLPCLSFAFLAVVSVVTSLTYVVR